MGENSDVTLGSMLVPEAINPTEFSIAAIPGMLPCAPTAGANSSIQGKISSFFIPDFSDFRTSALADARRLKPRAQMHHYCVNDFGSDVD